MDSSGSSEDLLDTSLESSPSDAGGLEDPHYHAPHRPSPFTLRSQCANDKCPMGTGILFRSRISPSPSKQRVWNRRRRRSDQSHLDNTTTTISYQDLSHDLSHLHDHSHHHHTHVHDPRHHHHNHVQDPSHHHHTHVHGHTQVYHVQAHHDLIDSLTHTHSHPKEHSSQNNIQDSQTDHLTQTGLTHSTQTHQTRHTHTTSQDQTDHTLTNHNHTPKDHGRTLRSRRLEVSTDKPRQLRVGEMLRHRSRTPRGKKKASSSPATTRGEETEERSDGGGVSGGMASIATAVKKNVLEFLSPSKTDTSLPSIVESSESGFEEGTLFGEAVSTSTPASDQFVGARQFFQERDTREKLISDYFSPGDTPSNLRESTRRLTLRKPFNRYIAYSSDEELEEWQHQPKSNYTYSESLTYRERVTPDRKIGSPNMSRRGLRGANMKQDFSTSDLSTDESGHLNLRTRTIVRPMDALSDTSDGEELAKESSVPVRRLRSSRSRSIDPIRLANGGNITRTHSTTTVTTTKTLHQGLDVESDVDDNSESAVPFRATPLTARSTTPLGRTPTPLGRAPTPVIRSSTPLRRSTTPINSHLEYLSLNNVGRGYVLTKGAIAEDVEEEEMEVPKNKVVAWSQRTWQSITWVSTVITTSIVMMAARAVTARRHDTSDSTRDRAGKSTSFMSSLTRTTRRVTTTTTDLLTSTKERIRKNPILLWIPLLFIILLLALVAYWWLLQSRTKTDDTTTDPSDGTSFLPLVMTSASELTLSVINGISQTAQSLALGISSGLLVVWKTLLALGSWLLATCSTCLHTAWVSVASMFSLLGTLVYAGLSHLLHFLYLILDLLQYLALTVLGFFTTSVSYIHGVFIPLAAKTTNTVNTQTILSETLDSQTTHTKTFDTTQETETWSITGWVSDAASLNWATDVYKGLVDGATTTKNWMWSGWMWMVLSVADALNTVATFILWLLGSLWFLACYLVSGLWTGLAYIFSGIIGFFTSTATTVSSLASATSSAVVHYSSLILMPFLMTSEDGKVVVSPPSSSENRFVASSEDSSTYIQVPKVQLEHLMQRLETVEHFAQQLEMLGVKLTKLEDSVVEGQDHNMEFQKQQASLRKEMDQLILKHQDLKFRQDELVGEVNHCCKDAIVAVENVERHLTTLLGDTFGLPGENTEGGGTAKNLAAWLSTYYVAKDELETRLTALKAAMQATAVKEEDKEMMMMMSKTATAQTTQVVMDAVLERLMVELQKQQAIMAEHAKDQVAQQVKLQVEKAAIILSEEVTNQMDQKLYNTKQQLQEGVMIAVKDSVPEHISAAIHEAVALAVSETVALEVPKAVDTKLPGMVNTAVGGAVDAAVGDAVDSAVGVALGGAVDAAVGLAVASAVSDAVEKAVTVAVTNIVTSVVPQAVADVVPQAVESALPDAVAVAVQEAVVMKVQEAVAAAVPEVVASVLPDAVTTAVNDSVVSAVSEALEQVDVSKAGGITAKVKVDGEEGMVVMAGSSPGTIPTTVNISHNSSNNGSGFFGLSTGLNRSAVMEIVKEALMKYDADKTGMVDHALESAGGNIISTRCTESYQVHRAQVSILGIPIYWLSTNNPRTIIQPDRMPGQCWAFKGSQGYIVVQLAGLVKPTGFTLEHIPKSLSPSGEIDSAPREFEVWGLKSEKDEGIQLGVYEYSRYGEPLQYFGVQVINEEYFPFIELKVNSNHGNLQYTCLYRFRVHGERYS